MKKTLCYTYLGENGTLLTTLHLEGIYSVRKYMLNADENKLLTKDGKKFTSSVLIPESDLDNWYEVEANLGQG